MRQALPLLGLVLCACSGDVEAGLELPAVPEALELPAQPTSAPPLDVLMISIDTLRADHLGTYGYERPTSPNIDALAEQSVVFEHAYSQSPKTATSHMTILTGLFPEAHGVLNGRDVGLVRLSDQIPTLATLLRRAGYRTEGYTGGGNMRAEFGFDQGFDVFEVSREQKSSFSRARAALERLTAAEGAQPFFLFAHTYRVHDPYVPPAEYRAMFCDPAYAGKIISSREDLIAVGGEDFEDRHGIFWDAVDQDDPADMRHLVDLYDAGIRCADDMVAELFEILRTSGRDRRTLIVLLSDHGEEFGEHGKVLHSSVYREVLSVPFILRLPADHPLGTRRLRVPDVVRMVDVTPTLLDLLGLELPDYMQGSSLSDLIEGRSEPQERFVVGQFLSAQLHGLQAGEWKYVLRKKNKVVEELYHVASDPAETRNLAGSKSDELAYMREQLERVRRHSRKLARLAGGAESVEMNDEMRRELQSLGYLGADDK